MADLPSLQQTLGVTFSDPQLLEQALVHSSYVNENPALAAASNERLEFLGDAILGFVIAEKLYQDFPALDEGDMTKLRASLVRRDSLAAIAGHIGLGDYLYLGKGEELSGGRGKMTNLAAGLEAVIAAVYLDQGFAATRESVLRLFGDGLDRLPGRRAVVDYKSQLQELSQAKWKMSPVYHVVDVAGPDHDKRFTVEVMVGGSMLGRGSGKSKRMAEAEAARSALERADFTE